MGAKGFQHDTNRFINKTNHGNQCTPMITIVILLILRALDSFYGDKFITSALS